MNVATRYYAASAQRRFARNFPYPATPITPETQYVRSGFHEFPLCCELAQTLLEDYALTPSITLNGDLVGTIRERRKPAAS
jgi:hypothetical protein